MRQKLIFLNVDGLELNNNEVAKEFKFINQTINHFPYSKIKTNIFNPIETKYYECGSAKSLNNAKQEIDKKLYDNETIYKYVQQAKKRKSNIHLVGNFSDNDFISSTKHLYYLIDLCNRLKIKPIVHLFLTTNNSTNLKKQYIEFIKKYLLTNKIFIGSISGSDFLDFSKENWIKLISVYNTFNNRSEKLIYSYEDFLNLVHQNDFDNSFVPKSFNNAQTILSDNDLIIIFNHDNSLLKPLIHLLKKSNYYKYKDFNYFDIYLITLSDYQMNCVDFVLAKIPRIDNSLVHILSMHKYKQIKIVQTEHYEYLTYYFDGLNSNMVKNLDANLIPSNPMANLRKTYKLTNQAIYEELINSFNDYDIFFVCFSNYVLVNKDIKLSKKIAKNIDQYIKKIYDKFSTNNYTKMVLISIHNNPNLLTTKNNGIINTNHISYSPFVVFDNNISLDEDGKLINVAPTIVDYLGIEKSSFKNKSLLR